MTAQHIKENSPPNQPTIFYFAYGSNLHLKQMKRRCPESKFIGRARLTNHRWQINERGYANVVECEGHWVDGLVYEINGVDEAKLDINEGVSKKAYIKKYMNVHLDRAKPPLYRRPISWIVDRGGPANIFRQAKQDSQGLAEHPQSWVQEVLVYISLTCITDSDPKDEYVNRINLGLADARCLGIDDDYIANCVRPFVPDIPKTAAAASSPGGNKNKPSSPRDSCNKHNGTSVTARGNRRHDENVSTKKPVQLSKKPSPSTVSSRSSSKNLTAVGPNEWLSQQSQK